MTVATHFGIDVVLAGWAHSPFGRLAEDDVESLVIDVGSRAIASAGLEPGDIDEVFLGTYNAGMVPLAFPSSLALQIDPALANIPATRLENACASGSAAVHAGTRSLLAGTARRVLVIGAEKMTGTSAAQVGTALLGADYEMAGRQSTTGFAGLFAAAAAAYSRRYGDPADAMAKIAAKNHRNGVTNPYAQLRKDLGFDFCRTISERNPLVADPLRRTDCSPVSDGAAAIVLTTGPVQGAQVTPVRLTGFAQANDFLPASRREPTTFAGTAAAWASATSMAGVGLDDLDLVEVHDCFTIAELIVYEAIGLTGPGQGARAVEEGWVHPGGRLPVNLSGGLKSKGHPVGATGVSQHVLAAMQLSGTAGDMQLPGARRAAVHNMGGLAVANYVGVLEAVA